MPDERRSAKTQETGAAPESEATDSTDRAQTLRETREAGLRAQGGGSSDEQEIREAARPEQS